MPDTYTRDTGITRRVIFQAWCKRTRCAWRGIDCATKWEAGEDLALHEINAHGGARRGEQDDEQ